MRRYLWIIIFVLLLWGGRNSLHAEQIPEAVTQKIDQFFDRIKKGEIQQAYEKLVQKSLISAKIQQVQHLVNQTKNGINLYGSFGSFEPISSQALGTRIVKTTYITHNQHNPLRWMFIFYYVSDEWVLISIEFDDNIEALLTDD